MDLEELIKTHLKMIVTRKTKSYLGALDEGSLHSLLASSDDALRMSLMCIDTALLNGWSVITPWEFSSHDALIKVTIAEQFCITRMRHRHCFDLNYYGQMLLHQWLQEHFEKVTIKGRV